MGPRRNLGIRWRQVFLIYVVREMPRKTVPPGRSLGSKVVKNFMGVFRI